MAAPTSLQNTAVKEWKGTRKSIQTRILADNGTKRQMKGHSLAEFAQELRVWATKGEGFLGAVHMWVSVSLQHLRHGTKCNQTLYLCSPNCVQYGTRVCLKLKPLNMMSLSGWLLSSTRVRNICTNGFSSYCSTRGLAQSQQYFGCLLITHTCVYVCVCMCICLCMLYSVCVCVCVCMVCRYMCVALR
jgi:hypothetical protein